AICWTNVANPASSAGWTQIAGGFANDLGVGVFLKVAGGSEPSTYSFSSGFGSPSGQILRLEGGVGAFDASGSLYYSPTSTTSIANGFSAAHAGVHIGVFSIRSTHTISTPPAGMTQ